MFKQHRFTALAAAVVAGLTLATPAKARWIDIDRQDFGQWGYSEQFNTGNGESACEILTTWRNGREMRLVMFSEPKALALVVKDPTTGMRGRGRGVISVDGNEWTADFEATDGQVAVARITNVGAAGRFLQAFAGGDALWLTLPWGQRIGAGLRGSQSALAQMNRCVGRM